MVYVEYMLMLLSTYKTNVTTLIVTDEAVKLDRVLRDRGYTNGVRAWQAPKDNDTHPYSLVWAHKLAIEEEIAQGNYTAYVYMEDDTHLSWTALTTWALDTEVLEPLNFTRCIYRTEVSPETGEAVMLDWKEPVSLSAHNRQLDVKMANSIKFHEVQSRSKKHSGTSVDGWGLAVVHRYFLGPVEPFQGMWIATRKQLVAYMASPY